MIRRWAFVIGVALAALMLSACWPHIPDDPNAKKEFCGQPCDEDLGITCEDGFACVSGVCLNSKVCDSCGQICDDSSDCEPGWGCMQAAYSPGASPKYCWPGSLAEDGSNPDGGFMACTQVTEDYCGLSCEHGDPQIGGYSCWNGVLIAMGDHSGCSTCGKDCTNNSQCAPGVECVQFPDYSGGTKGLCWDAEICSAILVSIGTTSPNQVPVFSTPPPTAPPVNPLPPQPNQPACGDGICDPSAENRDLCGADCPCVDDGVCGLGETGQCFDCITPQGNSSGGDTGTGDAGGQTDGGECRCEVVCVETDRSGNCTLREPRDCNGNRC